MSALEGQRINLGCGGVTPAGWLNVDCAVGARIAKIPGLKYVLRRFGMCAYTDWSSEIFIHDLRKRFPWWTDSVKGIYCSHVLEHMSHAEGKAMLLECWRVLKPGGVLRVVVPGLRPKAEAYLDGKISSIEFIDGLLMSCVLPEDKGLRRVLAPFFRFPHRCMYDNSSLLRTMTELGFQCELKGPFQSDLEGIEAIERAELTVDAVIVEGRPAHKSPTSAEPERMELRQSARPAPSQRAQLCVFCRRSACRTRISTT